MKAIAVALVAAVCISGASIAFLLVAYVRTVL